MNNKQDLPNLKIDLKKDTIPVYSEDGNMIFQEAIMFRKISKFMTGSDKDQLIPIAIYVDMKTGKPVKELLPKELWSEFGYVDNTVQEPSTPTPTMKINKD